MLVKTPGSWSCLFQKLIGAKGLFLIQSLSVKKDAALRAESLMVEANEGGSRLLHITLSISLSPSPPLLLLSSQHFLSLILSFSGIT